MKYGEKAKSCCMNADISIMYIITNGVYTDFAKDAGTRFDTLNYELEIPLPGGKHNRISERWMRSGNNDSVCYIETKNIYLFNR